MLTMRISAIICTYNGQKHIQRTLRSLTQQSLPSSDYEIIVVNNHSTDTTEKIVQQFIVEHPAWNISHHLEHMKGLSFARNKGIAVANAPIIVYIDDDAEANATFLEAHLNVYAHYPDAVAAGGKSYSRIFLWRSPEVVDPLCGWRVFVAQLRRTT
ncbi:MAG: glycosyltransferase family 2 protein [Saprospiraceae bacterium]|nr:glycosyltransferase family 2 protein [Saprospiraceae bacterium]